MRSFLLEWRVKCPKFQKLLTPKVVHSPSQEVFNHSADDQVAGMVQKASCTGWVLESGNKVLWILRLTLGYDDIYILNGCECSSGVFRTSSTITHLCAKRHLKARMLCFPEGMMGTGNLSAACFCSATQKAQRILWPTLTTVFSFYPSLSLLNFLFAQVSIFIILLDGILLNLVKPFLESWLWTVMCFHCYIYWTQISFCVKLLA